MSKIAIVTDTDASLPQHLVDKYNIRLVPINIHFGEEVFRTGIDMDDESMYERIVVEGALPTTSAPTPGQFVEAFQDAFDAGAESVICFDISVTMSATYTAAMQARELMPDRDITIVDTKNVSMGQGFMVLAAAEAVEAGSTKNEAIATAMAMRERMTLFGALATLKYLAMSGRVGAIAAGMANLLNIKPILTVKDDGKLEMLEKVRTRRKAWARAIELTRENLQGRPVERMAIVHVNAEEDARVFEAKLRATISCPDEILISDFTPGLSVHTGPGLIAVVAVASA